LPRPCPPPPARASSRLICRPILIYAPVTSATLFRTSIRLSLLHDVRRHSPGGTLALRARFFLDSALAGTVWTPLPTSPHAGGRHETAQAIAARRSPRPAVPCPRRRPAGQVHGAGQAAEGGDRRHEPHLRSVPRPGVHGARRAQRVGADRERHADHEAQ